MSMQRALYVVVDHETLAILANPRTPVCANYTSLGVMDTFMYSFPTDLPSVKDIFSKVNFSSQDLMLSKQPKKYIENLPDHLKTEEYYERKRLATLRAKYIYYQESYYRYYLAKSIVCPHQLTDAIGKELSECDDENSIYSYGIRQYASILNIDVKEAYDELKLLLDGSVTVRMRYFAWYRRNVDIINTLHTEEEMNNFSKETWERLLSDALL